MALKGSKLLMEVGDQPCIEISFWDGEELGAKPPPSCNRHQDCSGCGNALEHLSPQEREEVARMEAGVKVKDKKVSIKYSWLPCVANLRDNVAQARVIQMSVEVSVIAKGKHTPFLEEMEKGLKRGTFILVPAEELRQRRRSGEPMHYVPLHSVEQPGHIWHTLRVFSNSHLKACR